MAYIPFCPRLSYDVKGPIRLWMRPPLAHNYLLKLRKETKATQHIDCLGQNIKTFYSSPSFQLSVLDKKDILYISTNQNSYLFDPNTFKIQAYSSKNGRFYRVFSPTYYEELINHFSINIRDTMKQLKSNYSKIVVAGEESKDLDSTLYFFLDYINYELTQVLGLPKSRLE